MQPPRKYVKNILAGSFKAMLRDARLIDRVLAADPFEGVTWPRVEVPEADPFAPDERQRILAWFRDRRFGFSAGQAKEGLRVRPHPPYHAYVHTLFWTGMRPSEAAGLRWSNVDLDRARLTIVRSRHLYEDSARKTRGAQRSVDLLPETMHVLRSIEPIRVSTETFVFVNTLGRPLEQRAFLPHWHACLQRAWHPGPGHLRVRGHVHLDGPSPEADPVDREANRRRVLDDQAALRTLDAACHARRGGSGARRASPRQG